MDIRAGQHYRINEPVEVVALTHWRAPFTGGYDVVLPAGEVVKIAYDPVPGAAAVACKPVRYADLEAAFIPEDDRNAHNYGGYSLSIPLAIIQRSLQVVE